jgi:RNA recognition motif-containing protein
MEWNPMSFYTGTGKLHPTLQKFKQEFETNSGYVSNKIILNPELTKYSPYHWNDNTQYEYMTYIANNCKTINKPPIWFRNQVQESSQTSSSSSETPMSAPMFTVSKNERTAENSLGSERPGTFSINRIKQKVDGTRERVENEVAFRLMNFNSLVGIRPDEIKRFICDYGVDTEMYIRVVIPRDKETGENRNRAFVNFKSQEDHDMVYNILSNQRLMFEGAIIEVQLSD